MSILQSTASYLICFKFNMHIWRPKRFWSYSISRWLHWNFAILYSWCFHFRRCWASARERVPPLANSNNLEVPKAHSNITSCHLTGMKQMGCPMFTWLLVTLLYHHFGEFFHLITVLSISDLTQTQGICDLIILSCRNGPWFAPNSGRSNSLEMITTQAPMFTICWQLITQFIKNVIFHVIFNCTCFALDFCSLCINATWIWRICLANCKEIHGPYLREWGPCGRLVWPCLLLLGCWR